MAYLNDTKILTILKPSYLNVDDDVVSFMTNEYNKAQDPDIGEIVHINQLNAVESDLATTEGKATTNASNIAKIIDGTTTVGTATKDGSGNVITTTYATKSELSTTNSNVQQIQTSLEAIEDGQDLDSFKDVEDSLATKADKSTTYTKTEVDGLLGVKQDVITDLTTIRQGASKGATAVQDSDYVHTDNNYTTTDKEKLAGLSNYDDTQVRADITNLGGEVDNLIDGTTSVAKAVSDGAGNNIVNTYATQTSLSSYATKTEVTSQLDTKVDKVSGKALSTNDFTSAYKTKLDGIEAGAEVNKINSLTIGTSSDIGSVGTPSVDVTLSDKVATLLFHSLKGAKGDKGDTGAKGSGISSIKKTSTSGLVDTYTVTYDDDSTSTFTVTNGAKGDTGATGPQGPKGDTGATGTTPTIKAAAGANIGSVGTPSVTASTSGTTTTFTFNYLKGATGADASLSNTIQKVADVDNGFYYLSKNTDYILFNNYDGTVELSGLYEDEEGATQTDKNLTITSGITMVKFLDWGIYITRIGANGTDYRSWQGNYFTDVEIRSVTSKVSIYKIN